MQLQRTSAFRPPFSVVAFEPNVMNSPLQTLTEDQDAAVQLSQNGR